VGADTLTSVTELSSDDAGGCWGWEGSGFDDTLKKEAGGRERGCGRGGGGGICHMCNYLRQRGERGRGHGCRHTLFI